MASDDWDDEELCNLAAELEDRECNHRSSDSSNYEMLEIVNTNGAYTARGSRESAQWDLDLDDDDVQHASNVNEGTGTQKQDKRTPQGGRPEEGTRESVEPVENGNKESTLNGAQRTAATNLRNHVIGNLASSLRGQDGLKPCKSCGRLPLEKCRSCENSELAAASDEDVCDWLEEDTISDLELSIVAEKVESVAYQ